VSYSFISTNCKSGLLRLAKISTSEEWSSLGEEANGGGGGSTTTNNNEATNNLHLLAASAGLNEDGGDDSDSAKETPKKRRRNSEGKMQTDVVRVPGLSSDLQQQITKFDSSEFDDDKEVAATDAEGVWAPDIEQSFQEALAIYPPCGRRKIILSDEGKMYGRNELIARYIKLRTGKTRTRKQVSSHIQVLARRKLREIQAKLKVPSNGSPASYLDQAQKEKALQSMQQMSSAQIVSASAHMHSKSALPMGMGHTPVSYGGFWQPGIQAGAPQDVKPFGQTPFGLGGEGKPMLPSSAVAATAATPAWQGRAIATHRLRLLEFSACVEQRDQDANNYQRHLFVHIGSPVSYSDPLLEGIDVRQIQDKFPEKKGGLKELFERGPRDAFFLVKFWADLNTNIADEPGASYMVNTTYESNENMQLHVATKVCSFGKQVVEKLETEFAKHEGGRFVYKIQRSPMCDYMINFIHKLKHLPEKYMMNSVLENFTILQVITNRDTQETLLCIAFVFEVSTSEHGAQHHIYRLTNE